MIVLQQCLSSPFHYSQEGSPQNSADAAELLSGSREDAEDASNLTAA